MVDFPQLIQVLTPRTLLLQESSDAFQSQCVAQERHNVSQTGPIVLLRSGREREGGRGGEVTHRKRSRRWPPGTRRRWLGIQIQDWFFRRARGRYRVVEVQELSERGMKSDDGGQREGVRPAADGGGHCLGPAPATRQGFWELENLLIRRVLFTLTSRSCESISLLFINILHNLYKNVKLRKINQQNYVCIRACIYKNNNVNFFL